MTLIGKIHEASWFSNSILIYKRLSRLEGLKLLEKKSYRDESMLTPKRVLPISVFLSLLLFIVGGCATGQSIPTPTSTPAPRSITVSGRGKVFRTPDMATLSIGVHNEDENASRAIEGNNAQAQSVIEVLLEMGVEEDDIQVSNYNIFAEQRNVQSGNQSGTVYIVDNTVFVTVRDLDLLGEIMGTVVEAGANSVFGIQPDIADKTQAISEARRAAVDDAQIKAGELARVAGVSLGDIQSITEAGSSPIPVFEGKSGAGFGGETEQVPESFGQLSLTVEVSVVYNIR